MNRFVPKAFTASLAIAAALCTATAFAQTKYSAEIRRTSFGIPHIKAADYGSMGYGVGYAFAQDNFCEMADQFVTVRGERSRYFGPTATDRYQVPNIANDFVYTYYNGDPAPLLAGFGKMRPEVQAAWRGWIAGYNRYLKDTGVANLPAPCKGAPWVRAIDDVDLMRMYRWYALQTSGGVWSFIGALYVTAPPAASAKVEEGWDGSWNGEFWEKFRAHREQMGSNALALGAEATDNGRGMLLGTPHLPWLGTMRFYQLHVTVPGQVDAMGASLFGFPFVNIGFNKDVAWSHTNDTAAHFSLYQLKLDPANPLRYTYDGQMRDMTAKTVTIQVPTPTGGLAPVSKTFYSSVHGLIISLSPPIVWSKTTAFALADMNLENWRAADQWFELNLAASTLGVEAALDRNLGIFWNNTIAADKDGNAFYGDITPTPNIDRFRQSLCTPDLIAAGFFAANGSPLLDGSRSECRGLADSSALQEGLLPASRMPRLHTQHYAHNSNDSYWLTNPAYNLYSFYVPAVVGIVPKEQNLRTRLGVAQTEARLSGADGLGAGNKFTLPILQQLALANRSYAADAFLPDMLTLCGTAAAAPVKSLCDVLAAWDRKFELTSKGAHLFKEFWNTARSIPNLYAVPFDETKPLTTPSGLAITNTTVATALVNALAAAGKKITDAGLKVDAPLGTVQFGIQALYSGGRTIVPVHGGDGTSLGIYNAIGSSLQAGVGYIVNVGTSYIQTVQFTDSGVNAQGFLTYSQSTNPASPNFADQTARFSAKQWITLPFTESAITSDPAYRTSTISE